MDWLDIKSEHPYLISLVGGGGKTSLAFKLAEYFSHQGLSVLVTTSTKMYVPTPEHYDQFIVSDNPVSTLSQIGSAAGITYCCTAIDKQQNKAIGLPTELCSQLKSLTQFKVIIIEADGAKHRPIKAPSQHEPCIPNISDLVVGVIGADIFESPMSPNNVHRWVEFSQLTYAREFEYIDISVLHKLLNSSCGLFKNSPRSAKKVWAINKCDRLDSLVSVISIAERLLKQNPHIDECWLTSTVRMPTLELRLLQKED